MIYRGKVEKGVVVFERAGHSEGDGSPSRTVTGRRRCGGGTDAGRRFPDVIGSVRMFPPDMAAQRATICPRSPKAIRVSSPIRLLFFAAVVAEEGITEALTGD